MIGLQDSGRVILYGMLIGSIPFEETVVLVTELFVVDDL